MALDWSTMVLVNAGSTPGSGTLVTKETFEAFRDVIDNEARASAYNNAVQSIPNNAWTAIAFNSEDYDQGSMHSTSSNTSRITIPANHAGLYLMTAQVAFDNNATGFRGAAFYKNGAVLYTSEQSVPLTGSLTIVNISALAVLAVADYIELFVYQNSGAALNAGNASRSSANHLQVTKLR